MKSFISVIILAASFALLVPDNRGQAVNAAESFAIAPASVAASHGVIAWADERASIRTPAPDSDLALLLGLGFLGAVVARRLRAD
jgi:hypothetical protein